MVTAIGRITWLVRELRITVTLIMLGVFQQWFLKCGPQAVASASPGNLLEIQNLGPHPDSVNQNLWSRA